MNGKTMSRYPARGIADWLLIWAQSNEAPISNHKLQQLLYYAQGRFLGDTGNPVFEDEIEAWPQGPAVRSVYRAFKKYGTTAIDADDQVGDDFTWSEYSDVEEHLVRVWNFYAPYEEWVLRKMIYHDPLWKEAFKRDPRCRIISKEKMRECFSGRR